MIWLQDMILLILYVAFCYACWGLVQAVRAELDGRRRPPYQNWP